MGLLAPLFLLGALAIALPLWLHRLQTQSSNRVPFGSAMLLETTEQQVHVKRELKYRLLLAARIALLLLLAITFAKPFLEQPPAAIADSAAGTDLVVVDASLSMARTGVFEQARATARQVVDDADDGALIAILAAGAMITEPLPPSADKATQRTVLTRLEPGSSRVDFGQLDARGRDARGHPADARPRAPGERLPGKRDAGAVCRRGARRRRRR